LDLVFDELLVLSVLGYLLKVDGVRLHSVLVNLRSLDDSIEVLIFSDLVSVTKCSQSVPLPAGVPLPADASLLDVSP
jgi:hypothetical protein